MTARLLVVAVMLGLFAVAPVLWRRRQRSIAAGPTEHPPVPSALLDGSDRTWVLFTTPWCASCGPVEERLRASDPDARVIRVDATREPELAGAFSVKSAPTALLADRDGRVQARLVGAAAVDRYVTVTP
jgi:hypothetical protein